MTNIIALWIGAIIVAAFVLDAFVFGWGLPVIIMQYLVRLIDWLAVWR